MVWKLLPENTIVVFGVVKDKLIRRQKEIDVELVQAEDFSQERLTQALRMLISEQDIIQYFQCHTTCRNEMRNAIIDKLNAHIDVSFSREADIVYLMAQTRKLLEHAQAMRRYSYLSFYCDWTLHTVIDRHQTAMTMLEQLNEAVESRVGDAFVTAVHQTISPASFRRELKSFYEETGVRNYLKTRSRHQRRYQMRAHASCNSAR
jgi:hypothetical protein